MRAPYLLDTNICIFIAKHNPPEVRERFARHAACELAHSSITLGELWHGAERSQNQERALASIKRLLQAGEVHSLPGSAGKYYGQIRAQLQSTGNMIGSNNLWLTAYASAKGWILVSNRE